MSKLQIHQLIVRLILGTALSIAIWVRVDWTVAVFAMLMLAFTELIVDTKTTK